MTSKQKEDRRQRIIERWRLLQRKRARQAAIEAPPAEVADETVEVVTGDSQLDVLPDE